MSGYTILGLNHIDNEDDVIDVIGAFDIAAEQRRFNTLKNIDSTAASILLHGGFKAMDAADATGTPDRKGRRANIRGKLNWHANELKKYASAAPYPPGDDLKKWVMESFIEANVSDEGRARLDAMRSQMWSEIGDRAKQFAASPVAFLTGVPGWVWATGGVVLVGVLGYAAYKILIAAAPVAAAAYIRR